MFTSKCSWNSRHCLYYRGVLNSKCPLRASLLAKKELEHQIQCNHSVFAGENNVLTSARTDDADQSRTTWLLGDIWMLPSAADEEWNSPKRPSSTVANLQLFVNLYAEVSTFFLLSLVIQNLVRSIVFSTHY